MKVLPSKLMTTISFKSEDSFKAKLDILAKRKGINTSAYIKLILTKGVNDELIKITDNGLTVAEELEILASDKNDKVSGPFKTKKRLMSALRK